MNSVRERFFGAWGASAGFVVGAALVAWVCKQLGGWPGRDGGR